MSLFQCEHCGCAENTALTAGYHCRDWPELFDWTGIEERKGLKLCSACTPAKHSDGEPVDGGGAWHGQFRRVFLVAGQFETNRDGNLAHKESGDTECWKYEVATCN